jgi:elongation factor 1-alpha
MPSNKVGECKSIEMHHEMMDSAEPGDNVGFNVRGIGKKDIRRGDVAGPEEKPPTVAKAFVGQIAVLQHPSVIAKGYTPVFHINTSQVACTIDELQVKIDPKTGQAKEQNPDFLKTGDIAIVHIVPTRPMVIENVKDIPQLGRFAIRDMGTTVAAGMCVKVEEK